MNATADFGINFAKGQIFGFCSTTRAPAQWNHGGVERREITRRVQTA